MPVIAAATLPSVALAFVLLARDASTAPTAAPPATAAGSLRATLWQQTATEHDACLLQAYRLAERMLDDALRDPCACADVVQAAQGGFDRKPPAVVLDVDETVLDNAPAQARLLRDVLDGRRDADAFDGKGWAAWVGERAAGALPGVRRFLSTARARGVATFFVTNRDDDEKDATIDNLRAVGIEADATTVLTANETDGRPNDKSSRRATIARTHRIVLLCGDDLGDFVGGTNGVTPEQRADLLRRHRAHVGRGWVVLPNPVYGGWWNAVKKDPAARLKTSGVREAGGR